MNPGPNFLKAVIMKKIDLVLLKKKKFSKDQIFSLYLGRR